MIEHKLSNKTKSATVAEPKLFHQLNNTYMDSAGHINSNSAFAGWELVARVRSLAPTMPPKEGQVK
jgi:hypothetical protein